MPHVSPLVADISPLTDALRQFTPRAREDRRLELAGLQQQQDARAQQQELRSAQIQQVQAANKRQQIIDIANESRTELIIDKNDLAFALKDGASGLRNNLAQLASQKGADSQDIAELVEFANMAINDPEGAFDQLTSNQENINLQIKSVDEILGRTQAPGFTLSEGQQRFDAAGNVIATGRAKTPSGRDVLTQVQSSQILPDGSTVQVFKDGSTRVTSPEGRPLTGADRAQAVVTAQEFGIKIQSGRAGGRAEATGEEKRASELITRGIAAAESTAITRRALTLLDRVKTGGIAAISLATRQRLGIEGADEGELSNSLGKSVLSQLRETFGAAFTENEGLRLDRIEARFGKSSAANRRLLSQALRIAERTANRAIKAAKQRGNAAEVADIEDLLSFSLEIDESPIDTVPQGLVDNGDGTFTLPDGRIVRRTGG